MASTDSINTNNNSNKKMSIRSPLPPHVNALLKSSEQTPHRLLRSSCKPQSSKRGSSKVPVTSPPVSSPSTGSTSSIAGPRRVGRPPTRIYAGRTPEEDEMYFDDEPKKSVGAKLHQKGKAVTMSVIAEPYSEAVKSSSLAEAVNSSLVTNPEHSPSFAFTSSSCSVIYADYTPRMGASTSDVLSSSVLSPPIVSSPTKKSPHRRSSSGSRTPRKKKRKKNSEEFEERVKLVGEEEETAHVFQTTGCVSQASAHQTDVTTSNASLPVGNLLEGEVSMTVEQKDIAQEYIGEKQLGEAMESSANDTQSEDGERDEEEGDSNSEEFKVKRVMRKRSKRKSSADGYPRAKRGRRPGRGRGSRSARSSSSSRQSAESTPGAKLKVCNNCGTVSEKTKAKKCQKCKKFFYDHWAKRCKIPPCPKCHFSRKSRHLERIPSNCNRCGYPLPSSDVHVAAADNSFVLEREEEEGEEEEVMEYVSPSVAKNLTNVSDTYDTTDMPSTMTNLETNLKSATEFSLESETQGSGDVLNKSINTGAATPASESASPSKYGVQKEEDPLVKAGLSTVGSSHKEGHDDQISAAISTGATPQTTGAVDTSSADHEQTGVSSLSHNTGSVAITRSGKVYKQGAVKEATLKALKEKILSTQQREPKTLADAYPSSTSVEHSTVNLSEPPAKFFSNVPVLGTTLPQVSFPAGSHHLMQHASSSAFQTVYAPVYTPINTFAMQANNSSSGETSLRSKDKDNKPYQNIKTKQTSSSQDFRAGLGVKCQTSTAPVVSSVAATFTQSQSDSSTQTASGLPRSISLLVTDQTASRQTDTNQTASGLPQINSLVSSNRTVPSFRQTTGLVDTNKLASAFPRASSLVVINPTASSLPQATSLAYAGHAASSLFQTASLVDTNQTISSFPRASSLVVINPTSSSLPKANVSLAYPVQAISSFPQTTNSLAYITQTASSLSQTTTSLVDTNQIAPGLPQTTTSLASTNQTVSSLPQTTTSLASTNQTASSLPHITTSLASTNQTAPGLPQTTTSLASTNQTASSLPQTTTSLASTNQTASSLPHITTSLASTNQTASSLPQTTTSLASTNQTASSLPHITTSLASTNQTASSLPHITTSLASTNQTAPGLPQTTTNLAGADKTAPILFQTTTSLASTSQTASSLPHITTSQTDTDQMASSLPQTTTSLADTDQTASSLPHTTTSQPDTDQTASSLPQTTTSQPDTDQTASSLPQTTTSQPDTDQTASSLPQTTTSQTDTDQTASSLPQTTTSLADTDQTASSLPQTTTSQTDTDQTASSLPQTTTSQTDTDQTASSLSQSTTSQTDTDQTASSLSQSTTSQTDTDQTVSNLPQTTTSLADTDSMKGLSLTKSASVSTLLSTPAEVLKREDERMTDGEQTTALMDEDTVSAETKVEEATKTVSSLFFSEKFRNKYSHFQNAKVKPKSKRKNNNVAPQQPPAAKKKKLSDDESDPEAAAVTSSLNPTSPTGNVPQLLRYAQELGINFHLNLPVLPSDVKRPLTHIVGTTVPPSLVTAASLPMQQQQVLTTSKSPTATTTTSLTSVALSSAPSVATQTTSSVNKDATKHLPPLAPIAVSAAKQTSVLPSQTLSPPAAVLLPSTLSVYTPLLRPILLQPPPPLKPSDSSPNMSLPLSSLSTLMTPISAHSPSIVSCPPTSAPLSTSARVSATESKKLLPSASTAESVPKCIMNPDSTTTITSSQHSSSQHSSSQHSSSQHSSSQLSSSQHSSSQHSSSQHSSSQHSSSQHSSSQHSSSQLSSSQHSSSQHSSSQLSSTQHSSSQHSSSQLSSSPNSSSQHSSPQLSSSQLSSSQHSSSQLSSSQHSSSQLSFSQLRSSQLSSSQHSSFQHSLTRPSVAAAHPSVSQGADSTSEVGPKCPPGPLPGMSSGKTVVTARTFIPAPSTIAGSNVKVSVIATQFSPHPPLTAVTNPSLIQVLQTQVNSSGASKSSADLTGGMVAMASEPSAPKVVYTQTIRSSKVSAIVQKGTADTSKALPCIAKPDPFPKAVSAASRKVDSTQQASGSLIDASLQIIASNVQSRIKEVLQKTSTHEANGNTNTARTQNVSNPSGQNLKTGIASVQVTAKKPSDHQYNGGIPAKVLASPVPTITKQVQPPLLKPAPGQPPSLRPTPLLPPSLKPAPLLPPSLKPAPAVERKQPSLLPKAPGPVVTVRLLDAKETQNWSHKTNTSTVAEKLQRCTQPNLPQTTGNHLPTSVTSTSTTVPVSDLPEKVQPMHPSNSDMANGKRPDESLAGPAEPRKGSEKMQARRFLTFDATEEGNGKEVAMEIDSVSKGVGEAVVPMVASGEEGEESQLSQESDRESEGYFKLVSEETLASESDHTSEGGNNKTDNRQKESSGASGRDGGKERDEGQTGGGGEGSKEEDRGGIGGGEQWEGAGGSGSKRKKKSGSGGSHKKITLYSVKLKDCFFHHVIWGDSRMVLIVPMRGSAQGATEKNPAAQEKKPIKTTPTRPSTSLLQKHSGSAQKEGGEGGGSGERRRRRKAKLEPLVQEVEEDLGTLEESPSGGIPIPVHTPCFSVYELRHKLFSSFSSSAVYVYTYKNQIKSFRPPIHWVYVLKRMGGMQESCHTCRILEVDNVKGMCEYYALTMPPAVECLCRNELPKGRKVIDLSNVDPEDLDGNDLENIPFCSFFEKVTKKKKKSRKRSRKSDEVPLEQQQQEQKEEEKEEKEEEREKKEEEEQEEENKGEWNAGECEEAPVSPQRMVHADKVGGSARVRSPPPLIKHSSPPPSLSRKPGKKKPCPHCGTPVLRKCKKCPVCSKTFGVFTFGRRQCVYCGRVNLARMPTCVDCGESLHGAPIAMPKPEDSTEKESPALVRKLDFMFGVRKRRRVCSVPLPFPSNEGPRKSGQHQSTRHPSTAETEFSAECSDVFQGEVEEDEDEAVPSRAQTPTEASVQKSAKSKHAGYQYGRIPWADADITVLVDEKGIPKFCLQELCIKVLTEHVKSEVFEMVKDLKLPMESGDITLLKKLQALGLHSNRSPMCRLIAAEDLWALLDALQEPVPEEVHQHLENINSSTTPLMSPGLPSNSIQSPAVVPVAGGPGVGGMLDEDEHGFESTLHEVECSDGQYISILRAWNGEEYACLPEVWRKYFPEVNRNHLTSVLKRLELETHMPTGQQATLLRSAGVISLRGAPGRLMKLDDLQMLLDDFSIPLQIGMSSPSDSNSAPPKQSQPPTIRPQVLSTSMPVSGASTPHNKTLATVEDLQFAECMRNLLVAVEEEDLRKLLERSHEVAMDAATMADQDTAGVLTELDAIQQLMQARRDLCNILSKEIGFLTATTHGYMAEIIRLSHTERQSLQELDHLLNSMNVSLL